METQQIKVQLIEDNPGDARLIQEMLAEAKDITFNIELANNLTQGLDQVNHGNLDVILLDLSLPDSKGIDTFKSLYAKTNKIPIIVLSGMDDEELAVKAVHEGAQDYLVKGQVDGNLLVRSIRYAIERRQTEEQIKVALKEKEILLKEIHHRVKNNLQIISSLFKLQSNRINNKEALEVLKESQNRVRSMALIHEKLYRSKDLANIDFKGYIQDLIGGLFHSYIPHGSNIKFTKVIDEVSLGVETAIPCGLIINELISNALKYAFPDGREGEIKIALQSTYENKFRLTVSDNGIGIPNDLDINNTESLGLHLVNILAEDQLNGVVELDRTNGTKFSIEFGKG